MRPLTDRRAKPAIPVAGEPMIRRILRWLAGYHVSDVVMNLHHAPETLTAIVGDGSEVGVRVRYSWEQPRLLGSAGGPRLALPIVAPADREWLIVNGDTLTDLDVSAFAAAHRASDALVTLALVPNTEYERYGGVLVREDGVVSGFTRRGAAAKGSWHFIGVQAAESAVFADLQPGEAASTIGGIYDALMRAQPGSVQAFRTNATFWDVGTAADYLRMSQAFSATGVDAGHGTHLDPTARVTRSVLWDDVSVAAQANIDECIVTDGARVPSGTRYRRSILMPSGDALVAVPIDASPAAQESDSTSATQATHHD